MKTLFLVVVPLCQALSGSHVQVSIAGSTYSHGNKIAMDHPPSAAPVKAAPAPAPYHPKPAPYHPTPAPYHAPTTPYHHTPSLPYHPSPAPAYHVSAAPSYGPSPAPYHPKPAPRAYKSHPTPVYHSKMKYMPIVHKAPAYHSPTPAYHHAPAPKYHHAPAPAYHPAPTYHAAPKYHPAPAYHEPKQNCSIVHEMETVEVCTPAFETKCAPVDLAVKRIVDVEQCQDITRTVCSQSVEVIPNEICTYAYVPKTEDTVATTVKVTFEKECMTQMVTVCQPTKGYGYHSYGHQYCKEVSQETCYNVPMVMPMDEPVMVSYPEPIKKCVDRPISLPRISCEDITEKKCIMVPETMDDIEMVDKCETVLAAPSCQMVELTLPKQVCIELVYGHSYDVKEKEYHAKV